MFTIQQIREIADRLRLLSIKDSRFPLASDLTGEEFFPILQDGQNKLVKLSDLIDYINNSKVSEEITLSPESLEFPASGGTLQIQLDSNTEWNLL